jgi:hypothetical protein
MGRALGSQQSTNLTGARQRFIARSQRPSKTESPIRGIACATQALRRFD